VPAERIGREDAMSEPPIPETLPLDLKRQLDQLCDRFEAAWNAGRQLCIEEYLSEASTAVLPALLRELVLLDVHYRRRRGETPLPADYVARFPQLSPAWLANAFAPSGQVGVAPTPNPTTAETVRLAPLPGAGTRLGDYELLEVLGRGGMGVVWKARQLKANRLVAVKLILAGELADEADIRRFRAEAEVAANLDHPNLVPLYEVGEDHGRHFFSMKLIQGGHLGQHLAHYRDRPREAAALLLTVARAVQHAHQHGLLHRDLKPGNILLDAAGQPHVTDFGLARRLEAPGSLSQSGHVVGTPEYMAPEQARGQKALTTAADVYGLGAVLYALLTGRPPFGGPSVLGTLEQVVGRDPVAPRLLNRRVPRDLETICLTCLCKEPGQRYGSAAELAEELRRFLDSEPISARPPGPGQRLLLWARRRPALAAVYGLLLLAVLLGGLGGGALWLWQRTEEARQQEALAKLQAEDALRQKTEAQEALDHVLYLRNVDLAYREWQESGITLAGQLLAECPPARRHWEWHYLHRLLHGELLAFRPDHVEPPGMGVLAYSPDGTYLAGACRSLEVPVWDARTGRQAFTLQPNPGPVYAIAFNPDGTRLASAGAGSTGETGAGSLCIWDTRTRKQVRALQGHTRSVMSVAFSPDGKHLASAGDDGTVRVWDSQTGRQTLVLQGLSREGHLNRVLGVAFSPDGTQLASTGQGRVHVWDAASGREVLTLEGPTGSGLFNSVAFSPDGMRLAGAGPDKAVLVWDAQTGQQVLALGGHTRLVSAVAFSPPEEGSSGKLGTRLATASQDNTVRVWNAATGEETFCFRGHLDEVLCLAFSPDGTRLASSSTDRSVRVWDLTTGPGPLTLKGHTGPVRGVAFSPDGARLASGGGDGTLRTWNARTGQALLTFQGHTKGVCGIAFDPHGARLASAGDDQTVRVWDAAGGKELLVLRGHTAEVNGVVFSPDGARLASAGIDGTVRVWNAQTGAEVLNLRGHRGLVFHVAFSPDGTRLASASTDESVRIWEAATGKELLVLDRHNGSVLAVAFSPDGRRLAAGCRDHGVPIWDADTGREIRTLTGHRQYVSAVAFSPDGRRLASTSGDGTVRLWDTTTGQQALALNGGPEGGQGGGVAFSPDGRRLAAAYTGGVIRVWDASPTE
jgi:WD40 repeat protein/tRNA A-37 threonylcarbamoyl transferase component Bud32